MDEDEIVGKSRNLPHWTLEGSTYFVTFRLSSGRLTHKECQIVMDRVLSGNMQFYLLVAVVSMTDHVHLLLRPSPPYTLSRIMKGIKGTSARAINQLRGTKGTVWQDESWDRLVRDAEEFDEKLQYMADNPVKAERVSCLEEYPFWYCNRDFI